MIAGRIHWKTRRAASPGPRGGFTLLEMLLATALTTVMLLALWSLLNLYMRLFTRVPAAVEQSQLVRAVVDQIAHDLRCVIPLAQRSSAPSSAGAGTLATHRAATNGSVTRPAIPPASEDHPLGSLERAATTLATSTGRGPVSSGSSVGLLPTARLIGTSDSLQMEVLELAPGRIAMETGTDEDALATADRPTASKVPALKHVAYALIEAPELASDPRASSEGVLVRRERAWDNAPDPEETDSAIAAPIHAGDLEQADSEERFDTISSDRSADDAPETDRTTFVIPEVRGMALRYYDGSRWSDRWDSRQRRGLPLAVEIVLELASPPPSRRSDRSPADGDSQPAAGDRLARSDPVGRTSMAGAIDRHRRRFVVRLPTAVRTAGTDDTFAAPGPTGGGAGTFSDGEETLP